MCDNLLDTWQRSVFKKGSYLMTNDFSSIKQFIFTKTEVFSKVFFNCE